ALFVVGLVIGWRHGFSSGRAGNSSWRGPSFTNTTTANTTTANTTTASSAGAAESKVVRLNSRRSRNPFRVLATQIRIIRLKMRYKRLREHENSED
ncbi:MAG: hypothetical protein ACLQUY_00630, partial [Ktedonobacterales bacterium]